MGDAGQGEPTLLWHTFPLGHLDADQGDIPPHGWAVHRNRDR